MKRKCKEDAHTWKAGSVKFSEQKVQNVQLRFVLVVVTCGQSQRVWRVAADVE